MRRFSISYHRRCEENLEILEGEVGVELLRFELIIVHPFKVTVCGNSFENDAVGLIAFQQIRGHSYVNNVTISRFSRSKVGPCLDRLPNQWQLLQRCLIVSTCISK